MEVDLKQAREIFACLPPAMQLATLSPDYVRADAERAGEAQPVYWVYEEAGALWYHGFHLVPLPDVAGFDLQSPYGYGGPLANSTDAAFLTRAWAAYREYAAGRRVAAEFVRFHPLAANHRFYGGQVEDNRQTVWVDLTAAELFAEYQTRVRTAIRKAESAGVVFHWAVSGGIGGRFADFYHDAMSALGADPFYFFGAAYFQALAGWPAVRLGVCERGGEWLSAALFLLGGHCVEYHLSATSPAGRQLGAANLLLHGAATQARADGCQRLYLGGGTTPATDNPLLFYKGGFSRHRAPFKIGTWCHDRGLYTRLAERWPERRLAKARQMLFYR